MMRLFVAVALPSDVRDRLSGLCFGLPGTRWVPAANFHITLRFAGEVDPGMAEDLDASLSAIDAPAFNISLRGLETFGGGRQVRVLWVGVAEPGPLIFLRDKVESAVVRAGLEPEGRKYTPHVALARFERSPGPHLGSYLETHADFSAGPFTADHFTLFRSHLKREGPYYEVLAEYPLLPAFPSDHEEP